MSVLVSTEEYFEINKMSAYQKIKAVVVGDGEVGKTCMLVRYSLFSLAIPQIRSQESTSPLSSIITLLPLWSTKAPSSSLFGSNSLYTFRDTAGQEDYERLRPLSYPGSDIFLVCFSVVNRESFANAQSKVSLK